MALIGLLNLEKLSPVLSPHSYYYGESLFYVFASGNKYESMPNLLEEFEAFVRDIILDQISNEGLTWKLES